MNTDSNINPTSFKQKEKKVHIVQEEVQFTAVVLNGMASNDWAILETILLFNLRKRRCDVSQRNFGYMIGQARETVNRKFKDFPFVNKKRRYNDTSIYTINNKDLLNVSFLMELAKINDRIKQMLNKFLGSSIFSETLEWFEETLPFKVNVDGFIKFSENALAWAWRKFTVNPYRRYVNPNGYLYRLCVIYHEKYKIPY